MTLITEKAMLVLLNVSTWTARKHDKRISDEIASRHTNTTYSEDVGRYNKILVAQDVLKSIVQAQGAARTFHYENTLPWADTGYRILPAANYFKYMESMRGLKGAFEAAVNAFADSYPDYVADAKRRLNGMFSSDDYPAAGTIKGKFGFGINVMPMPDAADFRVTLNSDESARIRAEIEARTNASVAGAVQDLWQRVHDAVSHMSERLKAYTRAENGKVQNPFRDSLVENIRDLVALLPRLNLTSDSALDDMARRLDDNLAWHDADELRDDDTVRAKVTEEADKILADMASYLG